MVADNWILIPDDEAQRQFGYIANDKWYSKNPYYRLLYWKCLSNFQDCDLKLEVKPEIQECDKLIIRRNVPGLTKVKTNDEIGYIRLYWIEHYHSVDCSSTDCKKHREDLAKFEKEEDFKEN